VTDRVRRAIQVLKCFRTGSLLGVSDISRLLGCSKTVVHRILSALELEKFVEQDETSKKYRVGLGAYELGILYLEGNPPHASAVAALEALTKESGHTCYYGILDGQDIVILYVTEGTSPVRVKARIGERLPAYATAIGKVLLATMPEEDLNVYLKTVELRRVASNTLVDPDQLRDELRKVAVQGYGTSVEELYPGTASVAVPVRTSIGRPQGAVCASFPLYLQDTNEEIERLAVLFKNHVARLQVVAAPR